jgi:hypothetical protein
MIRLVDQEIAQAEQLVEKARPLFAGQSPAVVGAALGELCATFLASHAPPLRAEMYDLIKDVIERLTDLFARQMVAEGRAPEGWDEDLFSQTLRDDAVRH